MRIRNITVMISVLAILSFGLNACGYKTDPKPPQETTQGISLH